MLHQLFPGSEMLFVTDSFSLFPAPKSRSCCFCTEQEEEEEERSRKIASAAIVVLFLMETLDQKICAETTTRLIGIYRNRCWIQYLKKSG